jgi:hypothetical protein
MVRVYTPDAAWTAKGMVYVLPETNWGWSTAIVPLGPVNVIADAINVPGSTGSLNVTVAWDALIAIVSEGLNAVARGPMVSIV